MFPREDWPLGSACWVSSLAHRAWGLVSVHTGLASGQQGTRDRQSGGQSAEAGHEGLAQNSLASGDSLWEERPGLVDRKRPGDPQEVSLRGSLPGDPQRHPAEPPAELLLETCLQETQLRVDPQA